MTGLIRGTILAFLFAFVLSAELVEVRPVDQSKLSAVKDAESIVAQAQKVLDEAKARLMDAQKSAIGDVAESDRCQPMDQGKKTVKYRQLEGNFILIYQYEKHCGYVILTAPTSSANTDYSYDIGSASNRPLTFIQR